MTQFLQPIAAQIWKRKYQLKTFEGEVIDKNVDDTIWRVAKALAVNEKDSIGWTKRFYDNMSDFKFIPAGRIVAGAGTGRQVTLFNCFVMGTIEDSLRGIFAKGLTNSVLTMQQGGGIGNDFSTLRPKGAHVKGVDSDASGPLSFMDVWDSMCKTIMSAGSRRGAMMATMRCDHPDIEAFIEAKRDPNRLRMFNMSVMVTDNFMAAVKADEWVPLHFGGKIYKNIRARGLWDKIMVSTYHYAEPGVIFIDRVNQMNNLQYCETIASTNPCAEQPLPPFGACLLGSINLTPFVVDPFSDNPDIAWDDLYYSVGTAVRMLDNVVDISKYPIPEQEAEAQAKRRLGLGVTGVGDMFVMMNMTYGDDRSVKLIEQVMNFINDAAYLASTELAVEKGSFPALDVDKYLESGFMKTRSPQLRNIIKLKGIRNALLTSIAPTGTISLYANNVSSGIEPIFARSYERKVLNNDETHTTEIVKDYAVWLWETMFPGRPLSEHFVTAQTLTPADHIRVQAAVQKHIDSSISKTTNCPEDITLEDFKNVYMDAWDSGCKGCTTYRPNDVTGSVLTAVEEPVVSRNGGEQKVQEKDEGAACMITIDPQTGQMVRTCDA